MEMLQLSGDNTQQSHQDWVNIPFGIGRADGAGACSCWKASLPRQQRKVAVTTWWHQQSLQHTQHSSLLPASQILPQQGFPSFLLAGLSGPGSMEQAGPPESHQEGRQPKPPGSLKAKQGLAVEMKCLLQPSWHRGRRLHSQRCPRDRALLRAREALICFPDGLVGARCSPVPSHHQGKLLPSQGAPSPHAYCHSPSWL